MWTAMTIIHYHRIAPLDITRIPPLLPIHSPAHRAHLFDARAIIDKLLLRSSAITIRRTVTTMDLPHHPQQREMKVMYHLLAPLQARIYMPHMRMLVRMDQQVQARGGGIIEEPYQLRRIHRLVILFLSPHCLGIMMRHSSSNTLHRGAEVVPLPLPHLIHLDILDSLQVRQTFQEKEEDNQYLCKLHCPILN